MAYGRHHKVDTRIVRIFNTYGPRMRADDGRMVPNFIHQALLGEPLTVYGDGSQTRSIQYIDDLIEGCVRLMKGEEKRPVNIGKPHEMSVLEIARIVIEFSSSEGELIYEGLPEHDPKRRCPQIRRAKRR
jgi:dTDP-glucose 4,6-dehydratase